MDREPGGDPTFTSPLLGLITRANAKVLAFQIKGMERRVVDEVWAELRRQCAGCPHINPQPQPVPPPIRLHRAVPKPSTSGLSPAILERAARMQADEGLMTYQIAEDLDVPQPVLETELRAYQQRQIRSAEAARLGWSST